MIPMHTADIDEAFFAQLDELCTFLKCSKSDLLGTMMSESGVSSSARNPTSSATGLIQFMSNPRGMYFGMTRDEFSGLRPSKQLTYVRSHMRPYIGKLVNDAAVYLAVFLPAQIGLAADPTAVVASKDGPYSFAWRANAILDANNDQAISVGEMSSMIKRQCTGKRWEEVAARAGLTYVATAPTRFDLRTVRGVQEALAEVGFNPGTIDGIYGAKTAAAIKLFQIANRLTPDSIIGPETAAALRYFLKT